MMSSSSDNSFDDKSRDVAMTIAAPRVTRVAALVCKARLQNNSNVEAVMKAKDKPKKKAVDLNFEILLTNPSYEHEHLYRKMQPKEFNDDYYRKSGLSEVLLFDCNPEELGMKMVDDKFSIDDVERLVGGDKIITVVEVATQGSVDMPLKQFIKYYHTPKEERKVLYNVLSLEFSNSALARHVRAPALIQRYDWAWMWPDERKSRTVSFDKNWYFTITNNYPRVENYCLMSPTECYTDFHIDFHGTSVWYHVKKGMKVFWIVEPTDHNLMMYEEYLKSFDCTSFFGDMVEKCARVEVRPGNTLILPSGWIHAVYTPEDSLVFGGNFLHSMQIPMQLKVLQGEKRIGVNKKYRYPLSEEVVWFVINHIVKSVTGRQYIRPASRNQQNQYMEYVGDLFIARDMHDRVPRKGDYDDDGIVWDPLWDETEEYLTWKKKLERFEIEKINNDVIKDDNGMKDGEKGRLPSSSQRKMKDPNIEEEMEDEEEDKEDENENEHEEKSIFRGHDDWFPDETTFFHPESFGLDARVGATAVHTFPRSDREPPIRIDINRLRELIHPDLIDKFEALVVHYLNKSRVNLPIGLTRPNSLLHAFCDILRERRRMAMVETGLPLSASTLPDREGSLRLHNAHVAASEERKRKREERKMKEETGEAEQDTDYEPDSDYDPDESPRKKKKKGRTSGDARKMGSARWSYTPTPSINGYHHPQSLLHSIASTHSLSTLSYVPSTTGNRPFNRAIPVLTRTPYGFTLAQPTIGNSNPSSSIFPTPSSILGSTIVNRAPSAAPVYKDTPIEDKRGFDLFYEVNRTKKPNEHETMQQKRAWIMEWAQKSASEKALYQSHRCYDEFMKMWEAVTTRSPAFEGRSPADLRRVQTSLMEQWLKLSQSERDACLYRVGVNKKAPSWQPTNVQRQIPIPAPTNNLAASRVSPRVTGPAIAATMASQLTASQQNELSRRQQWWIAQANGNVAPSSRVIGPKPPAPNAAPVSKPNDDKPTSCNK